MRQLDREYDPALTWAGALSVSLPESTRQEIRKAWEAPEAQDHRAALKRHTPDAYVQLVTHVRERLSTLPPDEKGPPHH